MDSGGRARLEPDFETKRSRLDRLEPHSIESVDFRPEGIFGFDRNPTIPFPIGEASTLRHFAATVRMVVKPVDLGCTDQTIRWEIVLHPLAIPFLGPPGAVHGLLVGRSCGNQGIIDGLIAVAAVARRRKAGLRCRGEIGGIDFDFWLRESL